MSVPSQSVPPAKDPDLEITAELPVLDVAAYEASATDERSGSTDTWHMPALQAAGGATQSVPATDERTLRLEFDLRSLSENLRDLEGRLTRKGERLLELERELANARAERAASEERAAQVLKEAEERASALLRAAEDRATGLVAELAAVRTALTTEQTRATDLQARVDQFQITVRAHETRDYEAAKTLALREQEIATLRGDLQAAELRAARYLESLQSLEGRRNIFDEQLASLEAEIAARDAQLAELREQLAAASARTGDLTNDVGARQERIEALEREVASLAASLAQRNVELEHAERAKAKLQESVTSLTETVAARVERIRALESAAASHSESFAQRVQEIERVTRERDAVTAKATALETALANANATLAEKDVALKALAEARADLEKRLSASQQRAETLDRELIVARAEIAERLAAVLRAEAERDEQINRFAASEARAVELERRADEYQENIRLLQEELRASLNRTTELEGDLRAAEDAINRLEGELRAKSTKLDDLTKTHEEWRSTIETARASLAERDSLIHRLETEAANSAALIGNIQQSIKKLDPNAESGTHEIAPEGAVRLLIRTDGDSEVVHVLGRKTTVGRTPDNDLQIDAKFISRNHAVILAGPNNTIIEDLNSTNGIAVNGKRVSRHVLRDGDMVSI
ncbi:MAG TPA: FHA domain-containing protein, partial [Steroidobacteraceae bacterium]|nr:FHA domain-containing protein [Steroidobacteraceae bacterium]